jgi:hypothetical protein
MYTRTVNVIFTYEDLTTNAYLYNGYRFFCSVQNSLTEYQSTSQNEKLLPSVRARGERHYLQHFCVSIYNLFNDFLSRLDSI